jgi:hypothetical protein
VPSSEPAKKFAYDQGSTVSHEKATLTVLSSVWSERPLSDSFEITQPSHEDSTRELGAIRAQDFLRRRGTDSSASEDTSEALDEEVASFRRGWYSVIKASSRPLGKDWRAHLGESLTPHIRRSVAEFLDRIFLYPYALGSNTFLVCEKTEDFPVLLTVDGTGSPRGIERILSADRPSSITLSILSKPNQQAVLRVSLEAGAFKKKARKALLAKA